MAWLPFKVRIGWLCKMLSNIHTFQLFMEQFLLLKFVSSNFTIQQFSASLTRDTNNDMGFVYNECSFECVWVGGDKIKTLETIGQPICDEI